MYYLKVTLNNLLNTKLPKKTGNFFTTLALMGFVIHLSLIFLANNGFASSSFFSKITINYLEAIYTPFSFILYYEVLLLIFSIPRSLTKSVRIQFEIVSLITIRNVFKDLAQIDHIGENMNPEILYKIFIDMGSGIVMFFLVGLYANLASRLREKKPTTNGKRLQLYIKSKKIVALLLTCLLIALTLSSLFEFFSHINTVVIQAGSSSINYKTIFYEDLFSVMIFTDVFLLLLSMYYTSSYKYLLRNAGFVVATVLIRVSMSLGAPMNSIIAISAMVCGCAVLAIYFMFDEDINRKQLVSIEM